MEAASDGAGRRNVLIPLDGPDGLLARARSGDAEAREDLLRRYAPFALKVASQVTGTYVRLGRDDEGSVALLAFNEAIDSYDPSRGASFLGFVRAVIRRRLIDHYRHDRTRRREVPVGTLLDPEPASQVGDGGTAGEAAALGAVQTRSAEWVLREREDAHARQEEVYRYREMLAVYGISLSELVRISPRHADARARAIEAARLLASRPDLMKHLRSRGELPLKELSGVAGVSRKTLERQRKYIIAVALILAEDLPHLREYLR